MKHSNNPDYTTDFWTVLVLISDESKQRFIATRKLKMDSIENNRWGLPHTICSGTRLDPKEVAARTVYTFLQIKIRPNQLEFVGTGENDYGDNVYVYTNNVVTPKINEYFSRSYGIWFQTMTYHQVGLSNSGLDGCFRGVLIEDVKIVKDESNYFGIPSTSLSIDNTRRFLFEKKSPLPQWLRHQVP